MIISPRAIWIVDANVVIGALLARVDHATNATSYAIRVRGRRSLEVPIPADQGAAIVQMIDAGAPHAMARRSNRTVSEAKAAAARLNGRKGGRPRKRQPDQA